MRKVTLGGVLRPRNPECYKHCIMVSIQDCEDISQIIKRMIRGEVVVQTSGYYDSDYGDARDAHVGDFDDPVDAQEASDYLKEKYYVNEKIAEDDSAQSDESKQETTPSSVSSEE